MPERRTELVVVLQAIEVEMKAQGLWRDAPPSDEALASPEPFCVDTMPLESWLQWVLIPRMQHLLISGLPLPNNCAIYPMAEESFKNTPEDTDRLLKLIARFDQVLNQPH